MTTNVGTRVRIFSGVVYRAVTSNRNGILMIWLGFTFRFVEPIRKICSPFIKVIGNSPKCFFDNSRKTHYTLGLQVNEMAVCVLGQLSANPRNCWARLPSFANDWLASLMSVASITFDYVPVLVYRILGVLTHAHKHAYLCIYFKNDYAKNIRQSWGLPTEVRI